MLNWSILLSSILLVASVASAQVSAVSCGPQDPDCSQRLLRILSGIHFGELNVDGGTRFGDGELDSVLKVSVTGLARDVPMGDLEVLTFDIDADAAEGGTRIRLTGLDSETLFFCTDEHSGQTGLPPLIGTGLNCKMDATYGVGGKILEYQKDLDSGRTAMRWAELNLVMNMLHNGYDFEYLQRRLLAEAGASFDTILEPDRSARSILRLHFGMSGMMRTQNNKWELRALAGFRPSATSWDDYAIETRTDIMYNFLFSPDWLGSVGGFAEYDHWSVPDESIGLHASGTRQDSATIGIIFRLISKSIGG